MATFSPRRSRMLRVKVRNRGCAGKIASSGKNKDREALFTGSGLASGVQNPSHPERGKEVIENIFSSFPSKAETYAAH